MWCPRLVSLALVLAAATPITAQRPQRTVDGSLVSSDALPAIRLTVDPAFRFLGRMPFTIRDLAAGERLVFAVVDGRTIRRMFVLQFEGFLPGRPEIYRYDFSQAREIGGLRWRGNAWAYSDAAQRAGGGNEGTQMHRWLAEQGYETPDVQLMYRFVTLGDERRKDELILFYLEGVDDPSWLPQSETASAAWQAKATELERRALAAFRILP